MVRPKQHHADVFIVLALFLVYAACALMLSVLGAHSYRQTVALSQKDFTQRSSVLYLTQKVRQNDIGGSLRVESYGNGDALILVEQETGDGYETWIYVKDGYLCELLISAGSEVSDDQAQRIMPMQELSLSLESGNLLNIALTTDTGGILTTTMTLRSSGSTFNLGGNPPVSPFAESVATDEAFRGPTVMSPRGDEGGVS